MGGEVVGINTDTLDNNEAGIKEAKEILKAQGASYKNLTFDSNSTVGKYAGNIMAFPTTVLVDKTEISLASHSWAESMISQTTIS